jgi:hypothetical protein
MEELVDKAAVVTEIKRLLAFYSKEIENNKKDPWVMDIVKRDILQEILSFLDTLEVKENDLVEEIGYDDYMTFFKEHPDYIDGSWGFEETWTFAQYCYKLGLNARKGK